MSPCSIEKHLFCSLEFKNEFATLTKNLFAYSAIKYFSYNRFYKNKTWSGLYSLPDPVRAELLKGGRPLFVNESGIMIDDGAYIHRDLRELLEDSVSKKDVEEFFEQHNNPHGKQIVINGLLITRKGKAYDESFYFSLGDTTLNERVYYVHHLPQIKKFCHYFLYNGRSLLKILDRHRSPFPFPKKHLENFDFIQNSLEKIRVDHNLTSWTQEKKFNFLTDWGSVFLSKQEVQCLRLLSQGHSFAQMGQELDLSPRTIESYINNAKNKLNLNSKQELIEAYQAFSRFDTL